jgi:hypothetical protein
MPPMSLRALGRATLARQGLLERRPWGVEEAVERVGGLQAQEAMPPFVALWARLAAFAPGDLAGLLHARRLVRGTAARATLHLHTAEDYASLRPTLQPVLSAGLKVLGARAEHVEAEPVLAAARALLAERPRTFGALRAALAERFPDADERALGFTVRMLLPLVMVPGPERWAFPPDAPFALAEDVLGRPLRPGPDLPGLVLRHLRAFGPATPADVQAWSGMKGLRAVVRDLRPELVELRDARNRTLYDVPDGPRPEEDVPAPARLLGEFDSLLLAHADRTRLVDEDHRRALVTKNLRVRATFLLDGRVAGTWAVARRRARVTLTLSPFAPLPPGAPDELEAEALALLAFLGDGDAERRVEVAAPA